MSLGCYDIREIDYKTAMSVVVRNHYLHRKSPYSILLPEPPET